MWSRYFAQVLQESFEKAQKKNPAVSLRGYARHLQVSPSVLSEVLRNKRVLSAERAMAIAEKANLDPEIMRNLRLVINSGPTENDIPKGAIKVSDLILNPLYYKILCAFEIFPIPVSIEEVAAFLEIGIPEFREMLSDLEKFDVVEMKENLIYWQGRHVYSTEDVPSAKLREFHSETLTAAARDLSMPVDQREYTSVTFAACAEQLPEAKNQIRKFRSLLSSGMRNAKPDQIFQLSIQLRPLSKKLEKGNEQ